jgi:hypothetical protein
LHGLQFLGWGVGFVGHTSFSFAGV